MAMRIGMTYINELNVRRTRELKRVLNDYKGFPMEALPGLVSNAFKEDYLPNLYERLYLRVGRPIAQLTAERVAKKSYNAWEVKSRNPVWDDALKRYVEVVATSRIVTVTNTMKEFVFSTVKNATENVGQGIGIEKATQELIKGVLSEWSGAREWMARRIMVTESLSAMSVASDVSARSLDIPLTKTWVTAGINTREAHAAMDGETVDLNDFFYPDGEKMSYPRDGSFGASAANIINCSCTAIYDA